MSTLDRYRSLHMPSDCRDMLTSYSKSASVILGAFLFLTGLFSFSLGVASICVLASASYIGYGIFCGLIFTITGIFTMISACARNACLVMTAMVMSVMSIFMAGVQLSIGLLAAYSDSTSRRPNLMNLVFPTTRIAYDIFNPRNIYPFLKCQGSYYDWSNAWAPVDILLIIGAFFAMIFAIAISMLACNATCNGKKMLNNPQGIANATFAHEVYMTQPRNAPPVYKLTM